MAHPFQHVAPVRLFTKSDHLVKNLFGAPREWFEKHRVHLVDIDLR